MNTGCVTLGTPLTRSTEWLLRVALVCATLFFFWNLSAQTVLLLLQQRTEIAQLQSQLHPEKK